MPDYYDRLETQLSELTARGVHRRRRVSVALPAMRFSAGLGNVVALTASGLVAGVVVAALLTAGSRPDRSHQLRPVRPAEPPVIRNLYPTALPAPSGRLSFAGRLVSPRKRKTPSGEVRFYTVSSIRTEMILNASGLRKLRAGDLYAVWLVPGIVQSGDYQVGGWPPQLVGVLDLSVGSSGHLTIMRLFSDASFGGVYKLEITVQPRASMTAPGSVELERFVDF
jgi:hypothetical protein